MWLILSLVSALSESIKDIFGKIGSNKTNEYTSALIMHLVTLLFTVPFIFINPIPKLNTAFWIGSFAFLFITPLWSILYMKALKDSPLSITLPMMAFNPVFTGLLSYIFQGKPPSIIGWIGICLISIGIYLINQQKNQKNIFSPIFHIMNDKGALYMLGVAFLWSLGAHFSKMRVDGSSPFFSTLTSGIIGVVTTYILSIIMKKSISFSSVKNNFWHLFPIGFFYYIATITSSVALVESSAVYVFSIKRSSMLFSSLAGKLFFKEVFNASKYIGLALLMGGIVCVAL